MGAAHSVGKTPTKLPHGVVMTNESFLSLELFPNYNREAWEAAIYRLESEKALL